MGIRMFGGNITHTVVECSYEYKYLKDSIKNEYNEDLLILHILDTKSVCYSYHTYQIDSLRLESDYHEKWKQTFKTAILNEGTITTRFYYVRAPFYIYKDFKNEALTVFDRIGSMKFVYSDSLDAQSWTIEDSIKIIMNYECRRASCYYHGRKWIAWFASDIPLSNGPWKLGGLPGLIMEAHDLYDNHHFIINGLQIMHNGDLVNAKKFGKYKNTKRKAFLSAKRKYIEQGLNYSLIERDFSNNIEICKNAFMRYDFLETDYR